MYLKAAHHDLHSETFYSFIHHLCSCSKQKSPLWVLPTNAMPHFYVGPEKYISDGFRKVLTEFNKTACGPIFIGMPKRFDLTIVTTTYGGQYKEGFPNNVLKKLYRTDQIYICHETVNGVEGDNARNVFWLTPRHSKYIVPTFFPPTIVEKSIERLRKNPNKVPIFLVLGSFTSDKRNVASLRAALEAHRDRQFIVRFLGGNPKMAENETLVNFINDAFPDDSSKIQLMPNLDTFTFMTRVGEVDAVLPLVDETNFVRRYQEGRKLSSSVSWALGFGKKMVIYKELAEVFNIQEDNATYWHYDHSMSFSDAFGDCLNELEHSTEKGNQTSASASFPYNHSLIESAGETSPRCTFCEILIEPDMLVNDTGGNTCGSIQRMAAKEVNGSDICAIIRREERVCCPGGSGAEQA